MNRRDRRASRWQPTALAFGWRGNAVLVALSVIGLAWHCWPLWDSSSSPTAAEVAVAAPLVLVALICGLVLLAVAIWLDAGRRFSALAVAVTFILADTLLRIAVNPAAGGIEVVHALPILAGMAAGAPTGFLVGAGAMLLSTAIVSAPGTMLPAQVLILGLIGASGGLLWRLRPVAAWLASLPLAVLVGVASGVLLNLMGWAQEPGTSMISFYVGAPPAMLIERLWAYTVETSLLYDLNRGLTTLALLAIAGLPVLTAVRALGTSPPAPTSTLNRHTGRISPDSIERRQAGVRLDTLWKTGDHS